MSRSIIILAAGASTRMKSSLSKMLHTIAERPIINYVIETAMSTKPDKIILVTSPDMDNVRDAANSECQEITHAIQRRPLGTADAVKSALDYLAPSGDTIIMYGDTPLISPASLNTISTKSSDLTLVGFYAKDPKHYGRLVTYGDDLLEIVEFNDASDEEKLITHCNSGIYSVRNEHLHKLIPLIKNKNNKKEFYLTDIIKIATQHDINCSVVNIDEEEVIGINNREDLSIAERIIQKRIKQRLMQQGVTIMMSKSSYIAYDFSAGTDVTIHPNVFIGSRVQVGNNVTIRSFSHLEGAKIDNNAVIGPFARIRPDSHIAENSKIGNFVEIKNSQISHSTKINHLSYIGDSKIGSETNIGAGTITCNFDGIKTKSATEIGNNVSIGSNTCLIAPIKISNRAFIAAGSVITNDVGEDDLAFGRARQVTLKNKAKSLKNKNTLEKPASDKKFESLKNLKSELTNK
jgi:bifunctional UDP-N-acetylglucosamine pyrophosphorylase/glucosamine-1-phosphate N-acetyltransferase